MAKKSSWPPVILTEKQNRKFQILYSNIFCLHRNSCCFHEFFTLRRRVFVVCSLKSRKKTRENSKNEIQKRPPYQYPEYRCHLATECSWQKSRHKTNETHAMTGNGNYVNLLFKTRDTNWKQKRKFQIICSSVVCIASTFLRVFVTKSRAGDKKQRKTFGISKIAFTTIVYGGSRVARAFDKLPSVM